MEKLRLGSQAMRDGFALRAPLPIALDIAAAINTLNYYGLGDPKRGHRYDGRDIFSELDKLNATPLVRMLVPREALICPKDDLLEILHEALPASPEGLIALVRDIASNLRIWKKVDYGSVATIASVTRGGHLGHLLDRQNNRCCICGVPLSSLRDGCMHLDHIIPRALGGGDPPDRSNWRVLCSECNNGKLEHLSAFSAPETWGQPGRTESREVDPRNRVALGTLAGWWEETPRMRYAAFAIANCCGCVDCGVTAKDAQLYIRWNGCPSVLFATVVCGRHINAS